VIRPQNFLKALSNSAGYLWLRSIALAYWTRSFATRFPRQKGKVNIVIVANFVGAKQRVGKEE
jgi:hypothetical protein